MPAHLICTQAGDRGQLRCCLFRVCLAVTVGGILATCLTGCDVDRGPERVLVSGTVSFNGEPVSEGTIRFMPADANSTSPMAGAMIRDGKYKIDTRGGAPVGTHKILIEGYRVHPSAMNSNAPIEVQAMTRGVPRIQYLPKRYNVDSELQITIESGSEDIVKDFDLTN